MNQVRPGRFGALGGGHWRYTRADLALLEEAGRNEDYASEGLPRRAIAKISFFAAVTAAGRAGCRVGQVRLVQVAPRPTASASTLPSAFSSLRTMRIVWSDTPGSAARTSAMWKVLGACLRT